MSNSCDTTDWSLPGFSVHSILQARTLEWVAISFSRGSSWLRDRTQVSCTACRFFTNSATREFLHIYIYMYCAMLSHFNCAWLFATPWIKAHQAPLSMEFSRQEYCIYLHLTENWAQIKEMTRSPKVQIHLTNTKDHTLLEWFWATTSRSKTDYGKKTTGNGNVQESTKLGQKHMSSWAQVVEATHQI